MKQLFFTLLAFLVTQTALAQTGNEDSILMPAPVEEIYTGEVDEEASFPGGREAMNSWLSGALIYPQMAKENGIQGTVYVEFIVESNGRLRDIEIRRSPSELLNDEVIRLIKSMPKWIPAKARGKNVPTRCMLPIKFTLV